MEDKILNLFSRLIQLRTNEIAGINAELTSLYLNANILPALFTLYNRKINKEYKNLSICAIKKTLQNVFHLLTECDIMTLKQSFISLYQSEKNFDSLILIIDASSILFPRWPEILDFVQSLIKTPSEESFQLAMTILSHIPESLYKQSLEKYIEMCGTLITISLTQQINCRAALELFSSISHFTSLSQKLVCTFPDFYIKFLQLFQEYLVINNSDSFQIAIKLEKSIEHIEIEDTAVLLNLLIEFAKDKRVRNQGKIAIFNVINAVLRKGIVPSLFEVILQLAIECSSSLFDSYCYIENEASSISFNFLEYFLPIENFEDILIRNLKTTSPGLVFASLSAISSILPYISSPKVNVFVSYVVSSCDIKIHSISELAFSILYNTDFDLVCEDILNKIVLAALNNCMRSLNHIELQTIILQLIIKLLFNQLIPNEMGENVLAMLLALFAQEQSVFVRDNIVLCFAGIVECFDKEKIRPKLSLFVPLLIESSKAFNPQCVHLQEAAIESISVCISYYHELFTELLIPFISLLFTWVEDAQNRQHISSSIYSFQRLILSGNMNDANALSKLLQIILKYISVSESSNNPYDDIDSSGISFEEIQLSCIAFIRKLFKYFFSDEETMNNNNFLIPFLPLITSTLCKYVISNENNQSSTLKTIIVMCKCLCSCQTIAIFTFCDFFLKIFDNNLDLSLDFFKRLFNLDIRLSYPSEFITNIYSRSLQELQEGNKQIIFLFVSMSNKFNIFPIGQFIKIIKNSPYQLTGEDYSGIVSIFCNYMIHNIITQENSLIMNEIMPISFNSLHFCTDYSIKPSPIRFLSLLLNFSMDFNDQIISQFYPIFSSIFKNSSNLNLRTNFFNETIYESILFLLKVIISLPSISFPFDLFFPQLFSFLPPVEYFQNNSEILQYLTKLPCIPHFTKLSPYFNDLFACLIRIISLDEKTLYQIGIGDNSFSLILKFAFEMLRAQESRIAIIKEVTAGDKEKLINVQNRFNKVTNNPTFLQLV